MFAQTPCSSNHSLFLPQLAQSIRNIDFSQTEQVENLIRAHQKILNLADFCNECMSVTNCFLTVGSVYLSVVTGFVLITDYPSMDRIIDMGVTVTSIIRFGFLSELIKEVSTL